MPQVLDKLTALGITLPEPAKAVANYLPAVIAGDLVIVSGQLPLKEGKLTCTGKLGADVSIDEGYAAARQCASAVSARAGSGNAACEMAKVALSASQPAMASSTGKPAISTVRTAWSGLHGRVAVSAAPSSGTLRQFRAGLHAASIRAATQGNVRFMA